MQFAESPADGAGTVAGPSERSPAPRRGRSPTPSSAPGSTRRSPVPRPGVDTAYEGAALVVRAPPGGRRADHRCEAGLTSRVKRQALGIHEPVFGRLTSGMVVPFGEALQLDELIHPRAEPEIAFLIGKRIEAPTTVAQVLAATEAVFPAIEVVDSRYSSAFRLPDSVADNAGRRADGRRRPRPAGGAGRSQRPGLRLPVPRGDRHRGRRAVMGHPAAALGGWRRRWPLGASRVEPGSIVLTGRSDGLGAAAGHGVVTAEFDGLGSIGRTRMVRRTGDHRGDDPARRRAGRGRGGRDPAARAGAGRAALPGRLQARRLRDLQGAARAGEVRYERPIADSVLTDDERVEGSA